MKEFPGLVELHRKYGRDVACVSLSLDYQGIGDIKMIVEKQVKPFLQEMGATFDNVVTREEDQAVYTKLGLQTIPAVLVYDRDGTLHKKLTNDAAKTEAEFFTYKDVEAMVRELVAKK